MAASGETQRIWIVRAGSGSSPRTVSGSHPVQRLRTEPLISQRPESHRLHRFHRSGQPMAAPGDTRRCWILLVNSGLPPGTVSLSRAPILVPSVKSVAFPSSVCAICGTHIGRDDRRGIGPDAQKNGGVGFRTCKVAARREPYLSHVPQFWSLL